MAKDLKTSLLEVMKSRRVKVPALAMQTGIPKDRIYAWYRDNTKPKSEDEVILKKWISGEIYNPPQFPATTAENLARDMLYQQAISKTLIHQVAKLLSNETGRPLEDCLRELEQNTTINLKDLQVKE